MSFLIKGTALAGILSLAMATNVSASQPNSVLAFNVKLAESQNQSAQKSPSGMLNETRARRFLDEMIMLRMKMIEAAEPALQSPSPDIKKMAQETIKTNNNEINRMMEMRKKYTQYEDG